MTSHTFTSASHPGGAMSTTERIMEICRQRAEAEIEGRPGRRDEVTLAGDKQAWMVATGLAEFSRDLHNVDHFWDGYNRLDDATPEACISLLRGNRFGPNGWVSEWATPATAKRAKARLLSILDEIAEQEITR